MANFVNAFSNDSTSTAVPSIAVTATNQNAGDVVVVGVNWSLATSALPTVTDTAGNRYKLLRYRLGYNSSGSNVAYYYCLGIKAAASNRITAKFPGNATFTYIGVIEWSGVSGILDGGTFAGATDSFASSVGPGQLGPFGQESEAPIMVRQGSTYFWMCSGSSSFAPNACLYVTGSTPLGPWTLGSNPFQTATVLQTPQEVTANFTPSASNSYDSQCCQFVQIAGRNGVFYLGDRYDLITTVGNTGSDSFQRYQTLLLPVVFPTATTMTITFSDNWTFDEAFPTVSGAPAAPSGLVGSLSAGSIGLSWVNNEPNPHALFLDQASDSGFTQNVVSEALVQGQSSFTDSVTQGTSFFRVRAVNANGSSFSAAALVPSGTENSPTFVLPSLQSFLLNLPPGDTLTWQGLQWRAPDLAFTLGAASDPRLSLRIAVSGTSAVLLNADGSVNPTPLRLHKGFLGHW